MQAGRPDRYVLKDFPRSSHRVLLSWVPESPCRILDVGAATGYVGAVLSSRGHEVVGIERDPVASRHAAAHYAAFHAVDLATLDSLPEGPFDCILAADVLEHVVEPEAALAKLAGWRAPGGRMLLSVPNVAFLTVRVGLLSGRFTYRPRGILDRTHLRFFTRASMERMVAAAGLSIRRRAVVPPPLPLVWPACARWPARLVLEGAFLGARAWPGLLAYQLLAEVV